MKPFEYKYLVKKINKTTNISIYSSQKENWAIVADRLLKVNEDPLKQIKNFLCNYEIIYRIRNSMILFSECMAHERKYIKSKMDLYVLCRRTANEMDMDVKPSPIIFYNGGYGEQYMWPEGLTIRTINMYFETTNKMWNTDYTKIKNLL